MSRAVNLAALVLASSAGPGFAQSHADHAAHMGHHTATPQSECQAEAARHRAMGHAVPEDSCAPENSAPVDHADMDHGAMDHNAMDHASMGHGQMDHATKQMMVIKSRRCSWRFGKLRHLQVCS